MEQEYESSSKRPLLLNNFDDDASVIWFVPWYSDPDSDAKVVTTLAC